MPRLLMATDSGAELLLSIAPVTDRQSLGDAFTELRKPVCRYLLAMGLAAPEAEEVVQETFLRLCQHLDSERPRDNLRGWIFKVAHNLARDEHRRRRRQPSESLESEMSNPDPQATPEQRLIAHERTVRLAKAMARLPRHQQECLHLRAEGLRYREIADVLGAGVSTVAEWVRDAMKTLGKELQ
jgi:RNA polymerase sigma-70 factor, ECF subfamily